MAGGQYPVKPGRSILEIIQEEFDRARKENPDALDYALGLDYAIRVIMNPYNFPAAVPNNVVSIEEWKSR